MVEWMGFFHEALFPTRHSDSNSHRAELLANTISALQVWASNLKACFSGKSYFFAAAVVAFLNNT